MATANCKNDYLGRLHWIQESVLKVNTLKIGTI